jgi:hypothetical protein
MVVLRLITTAAGFETEFDGLYLKAYDPSFHPPGEPYEGGILEVTSDPAEALQFADAGAALKKWQESYGIRPDGEPNRPLTAWSIEIEHTEEARDGK